MSQDYGVPVLDDAHSVAVATKTADSLDALNTLHSGGVAPTTTVPYQRWFDTSAGVLKIRDSTNTSWRFLQKRQTFYRLGALAVGDYHALRVETDQPINVIGIALWSDVTTTGSVATTTEWIFDLYDVTAANSLFSALPSTATVVTGVGGGEITLDTDYILTANQNESNIAAGSLLEFRVTQNGAPTAITQFSWSLIYVPRVP